MDWQRHMIITISDVRNPIEDKVRSKIELPKRSVYLTRLLKILKIWYCPIAMKKKSVVLIARLMFLISLLHKMLWF